MLVLNRAKGEKIIILLPDGREVAVFPAEIRSLNKVRIGVEAPADVKIFREELRSRFCPGAEK